MPRPAHPLAASGDVVAPPCVSAEAFIGCLGERAALVLSPGSASGWFGGRTLLAWDPACISGDLTLAEAAGVLESAYESAIAVLAAGLVTYDGKATVACYDGGLVLSEGGWVVWGRPPTGLEETVKEAANRSVPSMDASDPLLEGASFDTSGEQYRAAVQATRDSIVEGDVYVLNLTARVSGECALPLAEAAASLRHRTAADMGACLDGWCGDVPWMASASPERFLRVTGSQGEGRRVEISPIKGTAPRGNTPEDDLSNERALLSDAKELAEHVMVVDMERNDIGVVCVPSSVHVNPMYEIVRTPYCHQLVSTVHGTLRPDARLSELLVAAFPCGSVTGAPKSSAMRLIGGLERSSRKAYCGSLMVAVPGEFDSSVLIRTLEGAFGSSRAIWGTGCGITSESDPASEWLELLLKASPVLGDGFPPVALRETMRLVGGRAPLLDRHLARLASGGCGPTLLATVREKIAEKTTTLPADDAILRLSVTVTADGSVEVGVSDAVSTISVPGGVRFAVVEVDRLPDLPSSAAKPAARRFWDLAHRKATNCDAHQAVLATTGGTLIDGSTANVWLVCEGQLLTPPAPPAIAGVARGLVFDVAARLGISAAEATLTTDDLEAADEVFFSNAHGGVALAVGHGGPVGEAIAAAFEEVMAGGRAP